MLHPDDIAQKTEPAAGIGAEPRVLVEADAIEIWIARWLRIRPVHLSMRYGCQPRRFYEIWWGQKFPASRSKAEALFRRRYPGLVESTGFGYKRIPRVAPTEEARQMNLFD